MTNSRHVYIYQDNEDNLKKEENVSALINQLLREYFKSKDSNVQMHNMSIEEAQKRIEILKIEIEAERKIKELKNEP